MKRRPRNSRTSSGTLNSKASVQGHVFFCAFSFSLENREGRKKSQQLSKSYLTDIISSESPMSLLFFRCLFAVDFPSPSHLMSKNQGKVISYFGLFHYTIYFTLLIFGLHTLNSLALLSHFPFFILQLQIEKEGETHKLPETLPPFNVDTFIH